jgi:TRAP-type C4-dicarboxylate transport system substrate-binding protein
VFPELYAALVPFMFDSYAAGNLFFDESEYWKQCQDEFAARTGIELLESVEEGGFLAFTNSKRPLHSPADFKGLKFRAMDDSQVALFRSFGASAVPIPWTELYTALQTGVADGQMNPPMYIIIGSLYEVQDYMTMANIQYSMQYLLINSELMESLDNELRQAIREAADEAKRMTRADVEARVEERTQFIADKGVEVYYPTREEMEQFRDAGQDEFISWLEKRMDPGWVDLALEGARNANEQVRGQ